MLNLKNIFSKRNSNTYVLHLKSRLAKLCEIEYRGTEIITKVVFEIPFDCLQDDASVLVDFVRKHLPAENTRSVGLRVVIDSRNVFAYVLDPTSYKEETPVPIAQILASEVPEVLENTLWSTRNVNWVKSQLNIDADSLEQIEVVAEKCSEKIKRLRNEVGILIEAVESDVFSLARFTGDISGPHVISYARQDGSADSLLVFAYKGVVFMSDNLIQPPGVLEFRRFLTEVKEKFNLTSNLIVVGGDLGGINLAELEESGLNYIIKDLDPVVGMALRRVGRDDDKIPNIALR